MVFIVEYFNAVNSVLPQALHFTNSYSVTYIFEIILAFLFFQTNYSVQELKPSPWAELFRGLRAEKVPLNIAEQI